MNDPVHTLEDILEHGRGSYHGYYDGSVHYNIKVYGPSNAASSNARTPYDLPTTYTFPVDLDQHKELFRNVNAMDLEADIQNAFENQNLHVVRGGVQASQRGPGCDY